ncbi:hypothetical protein HUZ36_04725 [Pseudoalteromonas sp. McH1-7]|uniref:hypothetical protein n=1 Tax=Pseudoalteromonas sp. McH1-7 TaxID=2745574 RepID=UPI001590C443|nr:hypothetical protein [Pseudoalteromonas sp. McH1-7]NUZ10077.1 hypothetical protein [Pseudoalteromonas sp. McH1-7]
MIRIYMPAFTLSLSLSAHAMGYKCIIERVELPSQKNVKVITLLEKQYIGKEFVVNKRTGRTIGAIDNSYAQEPTVIDFGSKDNSYKVINSMTKEEGVGLGSWITALAINEYEETKMKSFTYLHNDKVLFGNCSSY